MTDATTPDAGLPATSSSPSAQDPHRQVRLTKIGEGRFKATNPRGGETFMGRGGVDPDFTPVELLLAAMAGCSSVDVDAITGKRAEATSFEVTAEGTKVRDEQGNRVTGLRLTFDLTFPADEAGDAARSVLQRAIEQSRDRLCSVSRTIAAGEPVDYVNRS